MGKPSPPPPPDYSPVLQGAQTTAASDLAAANVQADVARQQLAQQNVYAARSADVADQQLALEKQSQEFGVQQYADLKPYLQKYMQSQLDFQGAAQDNLEQQTKNAAISQQQSVDTYNRYMTTFAPKEEQFANEAFSYASPARQDQAAAAAQGDVSSAFAANKDAAQRQLMSYGVDPSQGAYGRTQAMNIAQAASTAAAGTLARTQTQMQGKQLEASAIEMGQKLPAQAIAQAQLGVGETASGLGGAAIGGGGLSSAYSAMQAGTQAMGSPTAYGSLTNPYTSLSGAYGTTGTSLYGAQNQALSNAGNAFNIAGTTMNNMYQNQMEGYKAQAAQSAGVFGGIGSLVGKLGGAAIGAGLFG